MPGLTNPMPLGVLHRMGTTIVPAGFGNPLTLGLLHRLGGIQVAQAGFGTPLTLGLLHRLAGERTAFVAWWLYYLDDLNLAMFKNVAGQKITLLAIDTATGKPKAGDGANITAYVSIDDGAVTPLADTTATEKDADNAKGLYDFDVAQAESNGNKLVFSGKSTTSNIEIVPRVMWTLPPNFPTITIANNAVDADLERIAGAVVSAASAQLGVNLVNVAGSAVNTSAAQLGVNIVQISGDATAADNAETAFDGGSFNVGGGGTVAASVTGNVGGNVTGTIGGLTAAALKDFFDTDTTTTYAGAVSGSVVKEIVDNTLTAANAGAAVWNALRSNHTTVGTFGQGVASVQGNITGSVASVTGNVGGNVTGSVGSIATGGIATTSFASGAIDAAAIAANAIGASELATDAVAEIVDAMWNELTSEGRTASSFGQLLIDNLNATVSSRSSHSAADVWAVGTRTLTAATNITSTGGTITVSSGSVSVYDFTTAAKALLQTEAEDALIAHNLDHLVKSAVDTNFATTVHLDSVIGHLADAGTSATFDRTTDSLEKLGEIAASVQGDTTTLIARLSAARAGYLDNLNVGTLVSTVTMAQVNTEVDTALADVGLTTTITGRIDAAISTRATPAQVNSEVDTALMDIRLDELLTADSDIDGLAPPAVGSVFHELMTKTTGSFTYDQSTDSLEALRDRGDAAWATGSTHSAADVWLAATRTLTASLDPTAAQIRAEMDSNSTQLAAIVADTNELQGDWADGGRLDDILDARASQASLDTVGSYVDTEVAAILVIAQKLDTALELDGAVYRFTTNALEQAPTGLSAAQVWDYLLTNISTAGSIGKLIEDNLDVVLSTRASQTSVDDLNAIAVGIASDTASLDSVKLTTQRAENLDFLDTLLSSRLADADYTAPDNASIASTLTNTNTILNRLGAWAGSGVNTILGAFRALFRKDADVTVPSDINADLGSGAGAANNTTDSIEAVRDRGDAAWATATGFSTHTPADVWGHGTRTLTSAANITSTGGTTVPQTGDSFARIGATGSGLTSLAQASVATEARLAELDPANLPADIAAIKADTAAILLDTGTDGVVVAAASKTGYSLTAAYDTYHARLRFDRDQANGRDEYTVVWFKNAVPLDSGVVDPTIRVVRRATGLDLIAETTLVQVGSTEFWKHDEATNRLTSGEAGGVIGTATIDGVLRTFVDVVGRDSE